MISENWTRTHFGFCLVFRRFTIPLIPIVNFRCIGIPFQFLSENLQSNRSIEPLSNQSFMSYDRHRSFLSHSFDVIIISLIDTWWFTPIEFSIFNWLKRESKKSIAEISCICHTGNLADFRRFRCSSYSVLIWSILGPSALIFRASGKL